MAEVVADVGEEGAAGAEFFGDGDGFVKGEVGDVGAVAEGVEHEDVEPFQQRQAFVRDAVGVGAVGEVADAKAEDFEAGAVLEADGGDPLAQDVKGGQANAPEFQAGDRPVVGLLPVREGVAERQTDALLHDFFAVERHRMPQVERKQPQVVEAENVVGVLVGIEDGVGDADFLPQELLPQIGRSIDKQIPQIAQYKPDLVTIEAGANDIPQFDEKQFARDFTELAGLLPTGTYVSDMPYFGGRISKNREALAASASIYTSVQPHNLRLVHLQNVTRDRDSFRDYAVDLFHPSSRGYQNWADAFWVEIQPELTLPSNPEKPKSPTLHS